MIMNGILFQVVHQISSAIKPQHALIVAIGYIDLHMFLGWNTLSLLVNHSDLDPVELSRGTISVSKREVIGSIPWPRLGVIGFHEIDGCPSLSALIQSMAGYM